MTQIQFTKEAGGHNVGATVDTTPSAADYLINAGYAEAVETKAKATSKRTPKDASDGAEEVGDASPADDALTAG